MGLTENAVFICYASHLFLDLVLCSCRGGISRHLIRTLWLWLAEATAPHLGRVQFPEEDPNGRPGYMPGRLYA